MDTYRVKYRKRGTATPVWKIIRDGIELDIAQRKDEAVRVAKQAAKGGSGPAKLKIERQDGSIQDTFTYEGSGNSGPSHPGLM